ncbi:hypothetical protein [Streptomyces sp. NPDC055094]
MTTYVVAHGVYDPSAPQIVVNPAFLSHIRFYAQRHQSIAQYTSVGLASMDAWGEEIPTYNEQGLIDNYQLMAVEGTAVDAFYALMPAGADILFVGYGTEPIMYLCAGNGTSCEQGDHDCTGILGFYRDQELDFAFCREPVAGGPKDTSRDNLVPDVKPIIDECTRLYKLDLKGGSLEQLYNGRLADYVNSLPQEQLVGIRLEKQSLDEWLELRSAWTVSAGFTEGVPLGDYVLSQFAEAGPASRAEVLMNNADLWKAVPEDYQALIFMLHLAKTDPDQFRGAYVGAPLDRRAVLLGNPVLAWYVAQLCAGVDDSPLIVAAGQASNGFRDARALSRFVMSHLGDAQAIAELWAYGPVNQGLPKDFSDQANMVTMSTTDEAAFVERYLEATPEAQAAYRDNELLREPIARLVPAHPQHPNSVVKAAWEASAGFQNTEALGKHAVSLFSKNLQGIKALLEYQPVRDALPEKYRVMLEMLILVKTDSAEFAKAYRQATQTERDHCKAHPTLSQVIRQGKLDNQPPAAPRAAQSAPGASASTPPNGPTAAAPAAEQADSDAERLGQEAIALHNDVRAMEALVADPARFAALPEKYRVQVKMLILRARRSPNFEGEFQDLNPAQRKEVLANPHLAQYIRQYYPSADWDDTL